MVSNPFLCGWYSAIPHASEVEATRAAMLSYFSITNAQWLSDAQLNVSAEGGIACLHGKVDVAISGEPYWQCSCLEKQSNAQGCAQVIARTYLEKGMHFLDNLAGRFTIVLFDHQRQELVLCLDRMGQQHLYYAKTDGGAVFASRADSVVGHPSVSKRIDNQGIYDYLYFHAMPSPGSIYTGVNKLENGQYLVFSNGTMKAYQYWKPVFIDESHDTIDSMSEEMLSIIERSVARCVTGSVDSSSVGAFLSGGLDSSTVSGILSKVLNGNARTFSIGFDVKAYDEIEYARIASRHFTTEQYEYYVTPENVISEISDIAKYLDEPFGNSSVLPAYFCAKMAKEKGIDVLLAGDGGDEIFAGNERYAKQKVFERYNNVPSLFRGLLLEPLLLHNPVLKRLPVLSKIHSYIRQAKLPLPDRLEDYNYLHRHAASEIFSYDFISDIDQELPINLLRDSYNLPNNANSLNRMLWMDWKKTLHDNDLVKVNRMCEMNGVNVHYPLLDDELVSFSTRIPSTIKLKNGKLRWFYKEAIKGFLPQEIIRKKKHGFGLPFGVWTSEHKGLQELSYSSLDSLKKRAIFNDSFIDQTIKMHQGVHAKFYGELVWILMMLELWCAAR